MNILVFAGSPKGEVSVTMQYVKWLEENMPEHNFEIFQVAEPIRKLEQDEKAMSEICERVQASDGILWAFPLYVAMVHAGLKRFVELIFERDFAGCFRNKRCAILTTSIHFFDHTAVEYVWGISEDLGMVVDEVFSAEMEDLLRPGGTEQLAKFFIKWVRAMEKGQLPSRRTAPIQYEPKPYTASTVPVNTYPIKVGIVTQSGISANLDAMVRQIARHFAQTEIYNLSTMHIAGNCTGCIRCGYNNICLYEGKDEIIETYRKLGQCDAILFCGFVVDRYFSARWKTFVDRMFFSTHTPVFPGKPMGVVVSGPLQQLGNLRAIIEGVYGTMEIRLAGFATDEEKDVDSGLAALSHSMYDLVQSQYTAPQLFPALCGRKVFRDKIFGDLCGVFPADHRYYKRHGWYNFPQKRIGARLAGLFIRSLMRIPPIRKIMQENMKTNMLLGYRKVMTQNKGARK